MNSHSIYYQKFTSKNLKRNGPQNISLSLSKEQEPFIFISYCDLSSSQNVGTKKKLFENKHSPTCFMSSGFFCYVFFAMH